MRFQAELSTYSQHPQRKKKEQKERNSYYDAFNLLNPEGTIHWLLKGDILTSYEQGRRHAQAFYLEPAHLSPCHSEPGRRRISEILRQKRPQDGQTLE